MRASGRGLIPEIWFCCRHLVPAGVRRVEDADGARWLSQNLEDRQWRLELELGGGGGKWEKDSPEALVVGVIKLHVEC